MNLLLLLADDWPPVLVSHPMSLSPNNRIRMSGLYLCVTGILRRTKSLIVLPPFPQHLHSGHLLQLASLHVNLQALTERMTANDRRKDRTDSTTVLNHEV